MVTLAEELEFVRNYLLIEQARYRRRLHFEMPAPGVWAEVLLPGLTLQPLVENAIRHGISKRREGGTVKVEVERVETTDLLREGSPGEPEKMVEVGEEPFPERNPRWRSLRRVVGEQLT